MSAMALPSEMPTIDAFSDPAAAMTARTSFKQTIELSEESNSVGLCKMGEVK
jgi:hypothetical protein